MAQVATPLCNATAEQRVVPPELKVTVPVGVANPDEPSGVDMVAVSVAEVPVTIGLAESTSVTCGVGLTAVPETGIVTVAGVALLVIVTSSAKG